MKVGDTIKVKRWGFQSKCTLEVLEKKGDMLKVADVDRKDGGLISHMNESWVQEYLLKKHEINND